MGGSEGRITKVGFHYDAMSLLVGDSLIWLAESLSIILKTFQ